VRKYHGSNWK